MHNNSTDANVNGNGQAKDSSRDDDIDRTTNSSSKRWRRSNDNDDESKAKVDKDTDEQQQAQAEEQKDKEDSIQLDPKTPVLTKTYDGGSTGTSRDNTTDSNRSTNDPWTRDCNGRRRTRLSTEQHVSMFLDNLNLNGEEWFYKHMH